MKTDYHINSLSSHFFNASINMRKLKNMSDDEFIYRELEKNKEFRNKK